MKTTKDKRRKTLDEYLGINAKNTTMILTIAIVSSVITGGILSIVSPVLGLYGGYYVYKQRKDSTIPTKTKKIRIALFVIWLVIIGILSSLKS